MLTVYFDTSFFHRLGKAGSIAAQQTIDELNQLQVRHVLSPTLLQELLTWENEPQRDRVIVKSTAVFEIPPLRLTELGWDVLLTKGQDRELAANRIREFNEGLLVAESHALLATASLTDEQDKAVLEAGKDGLIDAGFLVPGEALDPLKLLERGKAMYELHIGEPLPDPLSPDFMTKVEEQLRRVFGNEVVDRGTNERALNRQTLGASERPYGVVTGSAGRKARKKLSASLRDTTHMSRFIVHSDEIDLLQIDGPQMAKLRSMPSHPLGPFRDRVFVANSLNEALTAVQQRTR